MDPSEAEPPSGGRPTLEPEPEPLPRPPSALGPPAWPAVGSVLSGSLDLLGRSNRSLRVASLTIGALALGTVGPFVLVLLANDRPLDELVRSGGDTALAVTLIVAFLGLIALGTESQILALAILGGSFVGRPLTFLEALRRSRAVFWRVIRLSLLVGIATELATGWLGSRLGSLLGQDSEASVIGASLLTAVIMAPAVYGVAGIVLGDVGAVESLRRSFRLARARYRLALLVSLFGVVAQYLFVAALGAGFSLEGTLLSPFSAQLQALSPGTWPWLAVLGGGALVAIFALGTLTFTIGALSAAPQVVAFLRLTGYARGLDGARDPEGAGSEARPARLSRPMAIGIGLAVFAMAIDLPSLVR